jgi:hypothetical protein
MARSRPCRTMARVAEASVTPMRVRPVNVFFAGSIVNSNAYRVGRAPAGSLPSSRGGGTASPAELGTVELAGGAGTVATGCPAHAAVSIMTAIERVGRMTQPRSHRESTAVKGLRVNRSRIPR